MWKVVVLIAGFLVLQALSVHPVCYINRLEHDGVVTNFDETTNVMTEAGLKYTMDPCPNVNGQSNTYSMSYEYENMDWVATVVMDDSTMSGNYLGHSELKDAAMEIDGMSAGRRDYITEAKDVLASLKSRDDVSRAAKELSRIGTAQVNQAIRDKFSRSRESVETSLMLSNKGIKTSVNIRFTSPMDNGENRESGETTMTGKIAMKINGLAMVPAAVIEYSSAVSADFDATMSSAAYAVHQLNENYWLPVYTNDSAGFGANADFMGFELHTDYSVPNLKGRFGAIMYTSPDTITTPVAMTANTMKSAFKITDWQYGSGFDRLALGMYLITFNVQTEFDLGAEPVLAMTPGSSLTLNGNTLTTAEGTLTFENQVMNGVTAHTMKMSSTPLSCTDQECESMKQAGFAVYEMFFSVEASGLQSFTWDPVASASTPAAPATPITTPATPTSDSAIPSMSTLLSLLSLAVWQLLL